MRGQPVAAAKQVTNRRRSVAVKLDSQYETALFAKALDGS
jgi:hypothetical protein